MVFAMTNNKNNRDIENKATSLEIFCACFLVRLLFFDFSDSS